MEIFMRATFVIKINNKCLYFYNNKCYNKRFSNFKFIFNAT